MTAVGKRQGAGGRRRQWVVASVAVLLYAGSAFAQDRLPPMAADKLTEAQKKAAA